MKKVTQKQIGEKKIRLRKMLASKGISKPKMKGFKRIKMK